MREYRRIQLRSIQLEGLFGTSVKFHAQDTIFFSTGHTQIHSKIVIGSHNASEQPVALYLNNWTIKFGGENMEEINTCTRMTTGGDERDVLPSPPRALTPRRMAFRMCIHSIHRPHLLLPGSGSCGRKNASAEYPPYPGTSHTLPKNAFLRMSRKIGGRATRLPRRSPRHQSNGAAQQWLATPPTRGRSARKSQG
jgi:hypothetical protein